MRALPQYHSTQRHIDHRGKESNSILVANSSVELCDLCGSVFDNTARSSSMYPRGCGRCQSSTMLCVLCGSVFDNTAPASMMSPRACGCCQNSKYSVLSVCSVVELSVFSLPGLLRASTPSLRVGNIHHEVRKVHEEFPGSQSMLREPCQTL